MLFAIGDVHGQFEKLERLMRHCRDYAEARGDRHAEFVLLGDYVDRGPQSAQVIQYLVGKPENLRAICGNHEDMMVAALAGGDALAQWLANGGGETLQSYEARQLLELPRNHLNLVAALPTFIDDGVRLFVHAGIDPADPAARDRETLLWTRKHPPGEQPLPRFIVHGHTPTRNARPELLSNRLNLDTGAGWGRSLTAAAFREEQAWPLCFITDAGDLTDVPQRQDSA